MIENLNKEAFASFGTVLSNSLPNHGFPERADWPEAVHYFSAGKLFYFRTPGELFLDFDMGMTVLVIRKEGKVTSFYLDKPVCLQAGTEFSVVPYQAECSVRMAYARDRVPVRLEPLTPREDLKVSDRVTLGSIYTLFYRTEESGFFFKGEQHSMYELTFVDLGQLHCVVDGTGYLLKQGQMMLFGPNQWHMQYTGIDTTCRFLTIAFDLSCEKQMHLINRVFDLSPMEAQYLRQILQEMENNDLLSGDFIRSCLKLLILNLLRDVNGRKKRLSPPLAQKSENAAVSRTLQYIADHVYSKLTVSSVAEDVGISSSHLTALFHRQMGISPGEYIRRVKLEESKTLIREGKMNFSQIAALLKYSSIHHFSRQFKDNFGISPSDYARSLKNS